MNPTPKKLRLARAAAWLLGGPLGIPGICDIVAEYGSALEGECMAVYKCGQNAPSFLAAFPSGRFAAGFSQDSNIRIYTGKHSRELSGISFRVHQMIVLRDGRLASSHDDNIIRVWRIGDALDECELELAGHTKNVYALAELPDGRLISGSSDRTMRIWHIDVFSRNEKSHIDTGKVIILDTENWATCLTVIPSPAENLPVLVASGSYDTYVRIWDIDVFIDVFSRNERVGNKKSQIDVCVAILDGHTDFVGVVAALPDRNDASFRLASGSADRTIRIWKINVGIENKYVCVCQLILKDHGANICALSILPDGRLASSSADKTIRIWNIDTRDAPEVRGCQLLLEGHENIVSALAVLPDGTSSCLLVSGSWDNFIRIWD